MEAFRRISALALAMLLLGFSAFAHAAEDEALVAWAKEQAAPLMQSMQELMADENYLSLAGGAMNIRETLTGWRTLMAAGKPVLRVYDMPDAAAILRSQGGAAYVSQYLGLGAAAKRHVQMALPQMISSLAASEGQAAAFIAASVVSESDMLARPDGFRPLLLIYAYEDMALMVSFVEKRDSVLAQSTFTSPKVIDILDKLMLNE